MGKYTSEWTLVKILRDTVFGGFYRYVHEHLAKNARNLASKFFER